MKKKHVHAVVRCVLVIGKCLFRSGAVLLAFGERALLSEVVKSVVHVVSSLAYECRLLVFIFGSISYFFILLVRAGMLLKNVNVLGRSCSVSEVICVSYFSTTKRPLFFPGLTEFVLPAT